MPAELIAQLVITLGVAGTKKFLELRSQQAAPTIEEWLAFFDSVEVKSYRDYVPATKL